MRKLNFLPKKEDNNLLNLIEYQKNKISLTLLKQKNALAQLHNRRYVNKTAEADLIDDIAKNRSIFMALSSFKYKSYINSKNILDAETNIKYSIAQIKNIENKLKIEIRNIVYKCLDKYGISRQCKLCNEIQNCPQLQQNYMPIIMKNFVLFALNVLVVWQKKIIGTALELL